MKSFVNAFVDIALTFFDSWFNPFLFNSVFFTRFEMLFLPAEFTCTKVSWC